MNGNGDAILNRVSYPISVVVEGRYGCFSRPEGHVERCTYPMPTPSAARGILEAVFWKPEFDWLIQEIRILAPVSTVCILRNEVTNSKINVADVRKAIKGTSPMMPICADELRAQRYTQLLVNPKFMIKGIIRLREHATETVEKYASMFKRRVENGQHFHKPYLGCREFGCSIRMAKGNETPVDHNELLGMTFFDFTWNLATGTPLKRHLFDAKIESGILSVPQELYTLAFADREGDA
jgi:CRISPR-associated protein Cas5d